MRLLNRVSTFPDGIPASEFALRIVWVAIRVVAVFCLGSGGVPFFYQAF
jgi:hypothetical protein